MYVRVHVQPCVLMRMHMCMSVKEGVGERGWCGVFSLIMFYLRV